MAFPGRRNVADTVQLRPFVSNWIVTPNVVEPLETICSTKTKIPLGPGWRVQVRGYLQEPLVIKGYHCVVGSRSGDFGARFALN